MRGTGDGHFGPKHKLCEQNLAYSDISDARPWWTAGLETLSKRFHVGISAISKGMQELRRLNIIDVSYPPFDETESGRIHAKSYKALNLSSITL